MHESLHKQRLSRGLGSGRIFARRTVAIVLGPGHLPRVTRAPVFHAMVLSAGFGTRLAPLTDEIPKPLVPIGDAPLLGRSLRTLRQLGASSLVVNTHHHAEKIAAFVDTLDFHVHLSHEAKILGTAGGIAAAREVLDGAPVIVVNGDIVGQLPVSELLTQKAEGLNLAVTPRPVGKGTVGLGETGEVVRLRGETFGVEVSSGDYMGVAQLGERCLHSLPAQGCLIGDWALPCLRDGKTAWVQATPVEQSFEDVGTPQDYLAANLNWLTTQGLGATGSFVGEGAVISAETKVVASVIGAGAHISGTGSVVASLILPGARARAPLSDSIVTPSGQVIPAGED